VKQEDEPASESEKKIINKPISFRLENNSDKTFVNKLAISRHHYENIYNENEAVLVKFDSRSKLSDLEFSEFLVFK
jgi:hypothetical protein